MGVTLNSQRYAQNNVPGAVTKAVLISGPTASGKSAAALALAKSLGGTVINADSMQVYRELRVLTARPDAADLALAPHRLYGIVSAREAYSVGRWLDEVRETITQVRVEGRVPIVVGGTGLYFKTLLEGLARVPEIPEKVRDHWRERAAALRPEDLHLELAGRDPVMAARLMHSDPQRVVRALEVVDATGVSLSEWQETAGSPVLTHDQVLKRVVAPERDAVYEAIETRFDRMLDQGALEEVAALTRLRLDSGLPAMRAHGVQELCAYLRGASTFEEAVVKAKTESRRFAKRQMTWLRRFNADWDWYPDDVSAAASVDKTDL